MPETIGNANPVSPTAPKKRNERPEAKFFEDVEKIIAEAERLAARTANQANEAAEETERNQRENLFKPLNKDISSLVAYAKSFGVETNQLAALATVARNVKGARAETINPNDGKTHISVANLSYVTRADNYARFIEQYETLALPTTEEQFEPATHRAKQTALAAANSVIASEAASNTTSAQLDNLAYLDAESLINACISAKGCLKSKYGTKGQPYLNIAKTRFILPSRLRKK